MDIEKIKDEITQILKVHGIENKILVCDIALWGIQKQKDTLENFYKDITTK